jgi:hypothetical protein
MVAPYRSKPSSERKTVALAFFHVRFLVTATLVVLGLSVVPLAMTTPRAIIVSCAPSEAPLRLGCWSRARSLWGSEEKLEEELIGPLSPSRLRLRYLGATEPTETTLQDLRVRFETRAQTRATVAASFGTSRSVDLTLSWPRTSDAAAVERVAAFEAALREGRPATLSYRSGWAGLEWLMLVGPVALGLLWLSSSRTRVELDEAEGVVRTTTRPFWLASPRRQSFLRSEVAAVVVVSAPAAEGARFYRPGLLLRSGELAPFGQSGLRTPARAEHIAALVRDLLEMPKEPIATVPESTTADAT